MAINTKETIVQTAKTVLENSNGPMEISTKDNSVKICVKAMEKCNGMTKVFMKVNGKEDYQTAKVLIFITKSGMFKAKGEKPRLGIFEDNILVNESRTRMLKTRNDLSRNSQTELLKMIPEITRRKKSVFRKRNGKSVNPSSTNSTTMTFKIGKRSMNKSHYN